MGIIKDKKTQTVLDCIRSPILILNSKFSIIELNEATLKNYNWSRKNVIGKNIFDLCRETNITPPVSLDSLNIALTLSNTNLYIGEKQQEINWDIVYSDQFISGEKVFILSKQETNESLEHSCKTNYTELLAHSMSLLINQMASISKNHTNTEIPIDFNQKFFSNTMLFDEFSEILKMLPGEVYWENRHLNYLGCNDYCAEVIGLNSTKDIISKNDLFIKNVMGTNYPDNAYDLWRKTALTTIKNKTALINMPDLTFTHPDTGEVIKSMTSKIPIVNNDGESIGIIGISINQNNPEHLKQITKVNNILKNIAQKNSHLETFETLSTKEFDCVAYKAKGMTVKQIASTLSLSPRTIETYLNRAKIKTQSYTTEQMVRLYWEYNKRSLKTTR